MKQRESAILAVSDLHFGKSTATYSPDRAGALLADVSKRLCRIRSLLGDYAFDELVICLLGDVVDGASIYPTQFHHQALTNADEQAKAAAELLAKLALEQQQTWKHIRFECVPGNHGRSGRFTHEAQNYDLTTYNYLELLVAPLGIPVNRNKTADPFIRKVLVRGHRYVIYHGMDIRMYQSIPWYGMAQRVFRWLSTHIAPFDVAMIGHFHSCGFWELNKVKLFLNGTAVTDDEWALRVLGYESAARWWLFGVSDSRPVTWQFRLELD